jgi:hypothetical protein
VGAAKTKKLDQKDFLFLCSSRVNSSESELSSISNSGGGSAVEPKAKQRRSSAKQSLSNHVVEHGGNTVHGNARPGHSENSVKARNQKRDTGLFGGLSESLVLHLKFQKIRTHIFSPYVSDRESSEGNIILADDSDERTSSILNRKGRSVGNVAASQVQQQTILSPHQTHSRRALLIVVLGMEVASQRKDAVHF